jgi:hypothetical protein
MTVSGVCFIHIDPERLREPMDKIGKEFVICATDGSGYRRSCHLAMRNLKQIQTNQLRLGVTVQPIES